MEVLRGISDAIAGERVLVSVPALSPYVRPVDGDGGAVRKRLNLFPQRALTHVALTDEQRNRTAACTLIGGAIAAGVIDGFEVALENDALVLMPGHGIAPDGSSVELGYPMRVPSEQIPVFAPQVDALLRAIIEADPNVSYDQLSALERQVTIARLRAPLNRLDLLPHAMVLVAMPRTIAIDRTGELDSPCPNATDEGAFSELAWEDGFQLAWVPWPQDASLPPWTADGSSVDAKFRNRLAYAIFNNERERLSAPKLRSVRVWEERRRLSPEDKDKLVAQEIAALARSRTWPWEALGVALALVGFDKDHKPAFSDRGAVVRQGGGPHNRAALVTSAGDDVLWQARLAQLVEHLAELPPEQRAAAQIAAQFDWLPPVGVLPKTAADLVAGRQFVFPASFDVQAQPVPIDMVDALIAESAPLLPFNLSLRDQVQILVPLQARYFDPDLLKLNETINPLFDREVTRLERARLDLLSRRDGLRRRFDTLSKAITGTLPQYPQDDPNSLPDEVAANDAAAFARVHVSNAPVGVVEEHGFFDAKARLELQTSEALVVFVRVDRPPPAISVELDVIGATVKPLVWGAQPPEGFAQWLGPLPKTGVWTRLTVTLRQLGLTSATLTGMRFGTAAGPEAARVVWGYAGKLGNGFESYWLSDAIPTGAVTQGPHSGTEPPRGINEWSWELQGQGVTDLDDTRIGLPLTGAPRPADVHPNDVREVTEISNLIAAYASHPGGLVRELGEAFVPAGNDALPLPSSQEPLMEQGLDGLIERMNARIGAADDHVEFGFLRARTDIFRVRQSVLGTDKAGQLLTSPAASELIARSASIAATEKEFDDYFARAKDTPVSSTPPTSTAPAAAPSTINISRIIRATAPVSTSPALTRSFALATTVKPTLSSAVLESAASPTVIGGTRAPTPTFDVPPFAFERAGAIISGTRTALPVPAVSAAPTVRDVVGSSLFATTFNTVTVGERLTGAASVETKNASASGKTGFVTNSLGLLQDKGIFLEGINVYGFKNDAAPGKPLAATSALGLFGQNKLLDLDAVDPDSNNQHEAAYFQRGLEAIDSMVRFLRGVELRAEDYRRLQRDAIAARDRIVQVLTSLQSMIDGLAAGLAETRHDLSVTRSLRAEEQARIDALMLKRKTILAEQVPYLVFRRPRFTNTLIDASVLPAQPAVVEDPVPACRNDTHSVPPELQAMVDTLKDVPARWFTRITPIFSKFDSLDHLQRLVDVSRERLQSDTMSRSLAVIDGPDTKTGLALNTTFEQHALRIATSKQAALADLGRLDASSWRQAVDPVRRIVSLGDLTRALPPAREPSLSAAGFLDDVAGVAGCLYAAFGQVPPATRLRWAEQLSELDPATLLRSLTVLPGFGNEASGVDFIAWRQMQMMVDWLFGIVAQEDDAVAAINDLVRVCLLLAAHAPVKRIISARVRRPVMPVPNGLLELDLDPRIARIGMQVLVHAPATNTVVARAVVEDIAANGASARFTQIMASNVTIDSSMRVQVQSGPPLSSPAKQQSEAARAVAVQAKPAPRASSGIEVQAERRIGKQVEQLVGGRATGMKLR